MNYINLAPGGAGQRGAAARGKLERENPVSENRSKQHETNSAAVKNTSIW